MLIAIDLAMFARDADGKPVNILFADKVGTEMHHRIKKDYNVTLTAVQPLPDNMCVFRLVGLGPNKAACSELLSILRPVAISFELPDVEIFVADLSVRQAMQQGWNAIWQRLDRLEGDSDIWGAFESAAVALMSRPRPHYMSDDGETDRSAIRRHNEVINAQEEKAYQQALQYVKDADYIKNLNQD